MNQRLVDSIVEAVLYEGYILYPYRPAVKNRQRWTFGGLYPRAYCQAQGAGDAWSMQTECLLRGTASTVVQAQVRFLHLQGRLVAQLDRPCAELPESEEPAYRVVERLKVGDRLLQSWQEAVQQEVVLAGLNLVSLEGEPQHSRVTFPASRELESVRGPDRQIEAILLREQHAVTLRVRVSAEQVGAGLYKLIARIENDTTIEQAGQMARDEAALHALASTHTILVVRDGEFCSLIDPPDEYRALAATCCNEGTWPVLVGREGETDTMLSSPITLYDYPQIAAESPGEFFDGTEIDEMLVLRILTLTDEEREAAATVDERVRSLLTRIGSLSEDQMIGLHGMVRDLRPVTAGESR
jgi:hydrogenase maturation protease